jgi:hypothetical protein
MLTRKPAWSGRYLPFGAGSMTVAPVKVVRGRVVPARRGMGADLRVDPVTGKTIDCDSLSNFFNGTCWGILSTKGTQSYVYGNTPYLSTTGTGVLSAPPPPPAPVATAGNPNPLIVPPANQQMAQDTVDATVAQQMSDWQAQNQQFFVDLSSAVDANTAAGGGCSQRIISGVCDWLTIGIGGALGIGLLMAFQGGRR